VGVKRTILVVEDEKDIRELVRFHLEQEGYAVREAESGESALTVVAAERPALVVLDLMLPAMGGPLRGRAPSRSSCSPPRRRRWTGSSASSSEPTTT